MPKYSPKAVEEILQRAKSLKGKDKTLDSIIEAIEESRGLGLSVKKHEYEAVVDKVSRVEEALKLVKVTAKTRRAAEAEARAKALEEPDAPLTFGERVTKAKRSYWASHRGRGSLQDEATAIRDWYSLEAAYKVHSGRYKDPEALWERMDTYRKGARIGATNFRRFKRAIQGAGLMAVPFAAMMGAEAFYPDEAEAQYRSIAEKMKVPLEYARDRLAYHIMERGIAREHAEKLAKRAIDRVEKGSILSGAFLENSIRRLEGKSQVEGAAIPRNMSEAARDYWWSKEIAPPEVQTFSDRARKWDELIGKAMYKDPAEYTPKLLTRENIILNRLKRNYGHLDEIPWGELKRKDPAAADVIKKSGLLKGGEKALSHEAIEKALVTDKKYVGELGEWTGGQSATEHFGGGGAPDQVFRVEMAKGPNLSTFPDSLFLKIEKDVGYEDATEVASMIMNAVNETRGGMHPEGIGWVRFYDKMPGQTRAKTISDISLTDFYRKATELEGASEKAVKEFVGYMERGQQDAAPVSIERAIEIVDDLHTEWGFGPDDYRAIRNTLLDYVGKKGTGYSSEPIRIIGEIQSDAEEWLRKRASAQMEFNRSFIDIRRVIREELVAEGFRGSDNAALVEEIARNVSEAHDPAETLMAYANAGYREPIERAYKRLKGRGPDETAKKALSYIEDWKEQALAGVIADAKEKGIETVFMPEHAAIQGPPMQGTASPRKYDIYYSRPRKKIGGWKEGQIGKESFSVSRFLNSLSDRGVPLVERDRISEAIAMRSPNVREAPRSAEEALSRLRRNHNTVGIRAGDFKEAEQLLSGFIHQAGPVRKGWTRSSTLALPLGLGAGLAYALSPDEALAASKETPPTSPQSHPLARPEQYLLPEEMQMPDVLTTVAGAAQLGTGAAAGLAKGLDVLLPQVMTSEWPVYQDVEYQVRPAQEVVGEWTQKLAKDVHKVAPFFGDKALYGLGKTMGEFAIFDGMFRAAGWLQSAMKMSGSLTGRLLTVPPVVAAGEFAAGESFKEAKGTAVTLLAWETAFGAPGALIRKVSKVQQTRNFTQMLWEKYFDDIFEQVSRKFNIPGPLLRQINKRSKAQMSDMTWFEALTSDYRKITSKEMRDYLGGGEGGRKSAEMFWNALRGTDRYSENLFRDTQNVLEGLSGLKDESERVAVMYLLKNELYNGAYGRHEKILESLNILDPARQAEIKRVTRELWGQQRRLGLEWGQKLVLTRSGKGKKIKYETQPIIKATTYSERLRRGVGPNYAFDEPKKALEETIRQGGQGLLARVEAIAAESQVKGDRVMARQIRRFLEADMKGSNMLASRWFRNFGANMRHAIRKMNLSETMRREIFGEVPVISRMYGGMSDLINSKYLLDNFEIIQRWKGVDGARVAIPAWGKEFEQSVPASQIKRWMHVPDDEAYGMLRNHYVLRDVFNYIDTITRKGPQNMWGRTLMPAWKMSKTVLNPGFHFRNLFSNTILNYLGGLPPWRVDIYYKALRSLRSKDSLYNMAKEDAVLGYEFVGGELRKLEPFLRDKKNVFDAVYKYGGEKVIRAANKTGKLFQMEEQLFKMAKYIHNLELGMERTPAARDALKWTFDYSDVSPLVRGLRENIMPFATFQFKMIPAMMESIIRAPWRLGLGIMAWNQLVDFNIDRLGLSEREWKNISNNFPDFIKSHLVMPTRDERGRIQMVDFGYIFPWGVFWDVGQHGLMRTVVQNPVVNILAGLVYNQDFAGRPIWYETMDPGDKLKLALEHVYQQLMPSVFFMGYDWQLAQDAGLLPRLGRMFDQRPLFEQSTKPGVLTPAQLASRHFGVKVFARSEDELAVGAYWNRMQKTQEQLKLLRKDMLQTPGERQPERLRKRQEKLQKKIYEIWHGDAARR